MKTNVSHVVSDGLCMGCGICQDACAKKCICIHHGKDVNYPVVDSKRLRVYTIVDFSFIRTFAPSF